jgi:IMP dehydrogenase/GMP reductase
MRALRAIAEAEFDVQTGIDQVLKLMVPFLAAGMRAESAMPLAATPAAPSAKLERV